MLYLIFLVSSQNSDLTDSIITQKIEGNSSITISALNSSTYTDFTIPDGYTFIGIAGYATGNKYLFGVTVGVTATKILPRLDMYNSSSASVTVVPVIAALLKKN